MSEIDYLVKMYLEKKGFKNAAIELDKALNANVPKQPLLDDSQSIVDQLLFPKSTVEKNVQQYIEEYLHFREWVCNSLEVFKSELLAICFPLFVTSYISIMDRDGTTSAQLYWDKIYMDHIHIHGREMRALAQISYPQQLRSTSFLESNPFIHFAQKSIFRIRLTSIAVQLVKEFFIENKYLLTFGIINSRIKFVIQDCTSTSSPFSISANQVSAFMLDGYTRGDDGAIEHEKVLWAVPGMGQPDSTEYLDHLPICKSPPSPPTIPGITNVTSGSSTTGGAMAMFLPENDEDYFAKIVDKLVLPAAVVKRKRLSNKKNTSSVSSSMSSVTVTNNSTTTTTQEAVTYSIVDELQDPSLPPLCSALEPSVGFVSIAHTYGTLTCMDMTPEAEVVVGGFDNSIVRIWPLASATQLGWSSIDQNRKRRMDTVLPRSKHNRDPILSPDELTNLSSGSGTNASIVSSANALAMNDHRTIDLIGHSKSILSVSIDPSDASSGIGRLVVSSAADETIRLWDCKLGQTVGKYVSTEYDGSAWCVSMAPFGFYFIAGHQTGRTVLYSTDRISSLRVFSGHTSDVTCCSWHPNMCYVLTASEDYTTRLWDVRQAGKCVRVFQQESFSKMSFPTCVQASPCGRMVAGGCEDGSIALWDISSGRLQAVLRDTNITSSVNSVSFDYSKHKNPSLGELGLISAHHDCSVSVWDIASACVNMSPVKQLANNIPPVMISSKKILHTKNTPVFVVKYNSRNMVYAGGPFFPPTVSSI